MAHKLPIAFHPSAFYLPLEQIVPLRAVTPSVRESQKYKSIAASLQEVGLIEPLIVYPQGQSMKQFALLDGTLRVDILRAAGAKEALCLRATAEEAITYNYKVNQLSPIQEHFMIMRALKGGASEERIAATLSMDVAAIRRKRDLLDGICREAVDLLKDRRISPVALRELKRVVPVRQVEMADIMIGWNNFSASFVKSLYTGTRPEQRVSGDEGEDERGLSQENIQSIRSETESLHREIKLIEESHGENVLNLVPALGYVRKLMDNARVRKYLERHHADIAAEFHKLLDEPSLGSPTTR